MQNVRSQNTESQACVHRAQGSHSPERVCKQEGGAVRQLVRRKEKGLERAKSSALRIPRLKVASGSPKFG